MADAAVVAVCINVVHGCTVLTLGSYADRERLKMSDYLLFVLLVTVRLLPLALLIPAAFTTSGSWRWSVGLIFVLAATIAPVSISYGTVSTMSMSDAAVALFRELLLGLSLGLGYTVLLSAMHLTSQILTHLTGGTLNVVSNSDATSPLQKYFGLLALALFVVSGGHRQLIDMLLESFASFPPGSILPPLDEVRVDVAWSLADLLGQSFVTGLQVAAPVAFCLVSASTVVAIVGRGGPVLGTFGLGLTVNMVVMLLVCCSTIGEMATLYQQRWSAGVDALVQVMRDSQP